MHKHNFIRHIVKYTVNRRKKQAKNQGRERLVLTLCQYIYAVRPDSKALHSKAVTLSIWGYTQKTEENKQNIMKNRK